MKAGADTREEEKSLKSHEKALLFSALFFASAVIPGVNGIPARTTLEVAAEAPGMMYMMHKNEIAYLSAPQLTDARKGTWTVKGTLADSFGEKKDAIVFTVNKTPLKQVWSRVTHHTSFNPAQLVTSISPREEKRYRVTYHSATLSFLNAAGPKQAELLEVKEMPPDPPQPPRSGIPFTVPSSAFRAAFSPF